MDDITREFYKMIYRSHSCRPQFKGNGDLTNVEFFMLLGISVMVDAKNGNLCYPVNKEELTGISSQAETDKLKQGEEQGITLGEIIKATEMSMSAASKKVSTLEKKGLIQRRQSKADRRNVYITITEKGREICAREREQKHMWLEEIIRRVGKEEMEQLIKLANRVFDVIGEMKEE